MCVCSVITELVVGYMLPGKPVAMMLYVLYGFFYIVVFDIDFGHRFKVMFTDILIVILTY